MLRQNLLGLFRPLRVKVETPQVVQRLSHIRQVGVGVTLRQPAKDRQSFAAAALNHPNVCTVYEIAEANGRTFISMAFLEGESLEAKIEAGPLKLKDALDIAIQTVCART